MIKVRIKRYEKGLLFRNGDFVRLLEPGKHRLWSRLYAPGRDRVEVVDTLATQFEHKLLEVLVHEPALQDLLKIVNLAANERALIWRHGCLAYFVGPGCHAFWNSPHELTVDVYDVRESRFAHDRLDAVLAFAGASKWLTGVDVAEHEDVLLTRDGQLLEILGTGRHVFWTGHGRLAWKAIDRREQVADVAGQEIMTRDKVTLRANLTVVYQVDDPVKAVTVVGDHATALYREAQLALRAAVGTRTLDALLADKEAVGGEVRAAVAGRAAEFGVVVRSVGLKDVILPGDMKAILNQVIEADKAAEANLIRRREETAAARSQANTAKLLADNPVLARMKELELLQEALSGARVSFVVGDRDLLSQLQRLAPSALDGSD